VFKLHGTRWSKIDGLELSPDTLLYGEIVKELKGEGRSQRKVTTFHIIDAISLGGIDISGEHLTLRYVFWRLMPNISASLSRDHIAEWELSVLQCFPCSS
jgi:hypothetical protein